jgi:hypothetical protein
VKTNLLNLDPATALKVLREFDPAVRSAAIDVTKTYTNAFVDKAASK